MVLMSLRTHYDLFCSLFHTNWWPREEDKKTYSFDSFCDLLIMDQHKLLDEGKLGGKQQAHFPKGKGKKIYKDRVCIHGFSPW